MPEQEKQSWTIKSLQEWCTSHLKEKGFESARLTTDLLLAHTLKCERIQLYAHFDKPLSQQELELFKILYKRRLENEPLQYIIGEAQFMGFTFYVDKRVLIPRPETEILVQETVQPIKEQPEKMFRVLDVGTGSGNIAISLAHLVNNIQLDAIDISDDALSVAEKNIQRHNVGSKVRLLKADAMNVPAEISTNKYDIIVSNPPYISNKEFALLSSDVKNY
ncbi:MAG: peptide chain release factor N(5)-glutamine methyltransferase, partial [Bacteroidetes bacterium]